ncbi:oplophorus-luciferin 2-monooxygenase non-catalytic subunit-like [Penaeus chinensis]|uniref:oplophorus-luciferin 2-monooxygenase non-catalytic subunit-like n=1 Tax=Penaeus chinensis TaxID=139456 RepID=UPI001FB6C0B8|nr:oplophorus-luciferin 2-monooxygenase non-catalytic subunit-like [Penaeus chinensis]
MFRRTVPKRLPITIVKLPMPVRPQASYGKQCARLSRSRKVFHQQKTVSAVSRREERALPCPSDVDVAPCVCSFDGASLDLDCSSVKDLDDLARVFQAEFPFPSFTSLAIADNPQLVGELPGGIFGPVTFQNITLVRTNLSAVSDTAFTSSASRLQVLDLGSNALTSFPFATLGNYFLLQHLDLKRNKLGRISDLESSSLEFLKLDSNPLLELTANTFADARYLRALYLNDASLKEVPVGLFDGLNHLQELYLMGNQIQTLSSGTFNLNSKSLIILALAGNAISQVEQNAFGTSLSNTVILDFRANSLTDLPESVWRPLIAVLGPDSLHIDGNSLTCGCDLCWLMQDATLLSHTTGGKCSSGEYLEDVSTDYCDFFCFRNSESHYHQDAPGVLKNRGRHISLLIRRRRFCVDSTADETSMTWNLYEVLGLKCLSVP